MEHDNSAFMARAHKLLGENWRADLVRAGVTSRKKVDAIALGRTEPGGALDAILEFLAIVPERAWPARWSFEDRRRKWPGEDHEEGAKQKRRASTRKLADKLGGGDAE